MPGKRITELDPFIGTPEPEDQLVIVDVSDTSMAPTGTDKKISAGGLVSGGTFTPMAAGIFLDFEGGVQNVVPTPYDPGSPNHFQEVFWNGLGSFFYDLTNLLSPIPAMWAMTHSTNMTLRATLGQDVMPQREQHAGRVYLDISAPLTQAWRFTRMLSNGTGASGGITIRLTAAELIEVIDNNNAQKALGTVPLSPGQPYRIEYEVDHTAQTMAVYLFQGHSTVPLETLSISSFDMGDNLVAQEWGNLNNGNFAGVTGRIGALAMGCNALPGPYSGRPDAIKVVTDGEFMYEVLSDGSTLVRTMKEITISDGGTAHYKYFPGDIVGVWNGDGLYIGAIYDRYEPVTLDDNTPNDLHFKTANRRAGWRGANYDIVNDPPDSAYARMNVVGTVNNPNFGDVGYGAYLMPGTDVLLFNDREMIRPYRGHGIHLNGTLGGTLGGSQKGVDGHEYNIKAILDPAPYGHGVTGALQLDAIPEVASTTVLGVNAINSTEIAVNSITDLFPAHSNSAFTAIAVINGLPVRYKNSRNLAVQCIAVETGATISVATGTAWALFPSAGTFRLSIAGGVIEVVTYTGKQEFSAIASGGDAGTTINVDSTTGFPAAGSFRLLSYEVSYTVTYTSKTATAFLGCSAHPPTVAGDTVTLGQFTGCSAHSATVSGNNASLPQLLECGPHAAYSGNEVVEQFDTGRALAVGGDAGGTINVNNTKYFWPGAATTCSGIDSGSTIAVADLSQFPNVGTISLVTAGSVTTVVTFTGRSAESGAGNLTGCSAHPVTAAGNTVTLLQTAYLNGTPFTYTGLTATAFTGCSTHATTAANDVVSQGRYKRKNFPYPPPEEQRGIGSGGAVAQPCRVVPFAYRYLFREGKDQTGTGIVVGAGTSTGDITDAQTVAWGVNALNSTTLNVGDTTGFALNEDETAAGIATAYLAGVAFTYTAVASNPPRLTGVSAHAATTGGELVSKPALTTFDIGRKLCLEDDPTMPGNGVGVFEISDVDINTPSTGTTRVTLDVNCTKAVPGNADPTLFGKWALSAGDQDGDAVKAGVTATLAFNTFRDITQVGPTKIIAGLRLELTGPNPDRVFDSSSSDFDSAWFADTWGQWGWGQDVQPTDPIQQATNKTTTVDADYPVCLIKLAVGAIGPGADVRFQVNNKFCGAKDLPYPVMTGTNVANLDAYDVRCVKISTGSYILRVTNRTGGSLNEQIVIRVGIIKGSVS